MYNKNAWRKYKDKKVIMDFAEGYKKFLNNSKTERLAVQQAIKLLEEHHFKNIRLVKKLKVGDKVYINNKNKNLAAFIIGKKHISEGMHILGAHIDSVRIDLKPNPIYEDTGLALLDTHYYGAIKKYQWFTIPLALVGVIVKPNGKIIDINIGLKDTDPIFGITDLLPHLSKAQEKVNPKMEIDGETLDITIGSMPLDGVKQDGVKANILKLLKDKYHIDEEDFISAEIECVPAYPVRDYGLDRSMVAGYGQDDRSCAYPCLKAILEVDPKKINYTSCIIWTDKEEVGSRGASGAESLFIENCLLEITYHLGETHPNLMTRMCFTNSKMISCDVSPAADPLFKYASAPHRNMARFGHGVCFSKYTGRRGKSGCNDARAEFIAYLRDILENNDIDYQSCELGAVDAGGGGTISYALAKYNMDVCDAGLALLSMHAPVEIISKVDLYECFQFYKAFLLVKN